MGSGSAAAVLCQFVLGNNLCSDFHNFIEPLADITEIELEVTTISKIITVGLICNTIRCNLFLKKVLMAVSLEKLKQVCLNEDHQDDIPLS